MRKIEDEGFIGKKVKEEKIDEVIMKLMRNGKEEKGIGDGMVKGSVEG